MLLCIGTKRCVTDFSLMNEISSTCFQPIKINPLLAKLASSFSSENFKHLETLIYRHRNILRSSTVQHYLLHCNYFNFLLWPPDHIVVSSIIYEHLVAHVPTFLANNSIKENWDRETYGRYYEFMIIKLSSAYFHPPFRLQI